MKETIIRIATIEDAKALLEIYAPYVKNTAITFEYEVPSEDEFKKRIENTLNKLIAPVRVPRTGAIYRYFCL